MIEVKTQAGTLHVGHGVLNPRPDRGYKKKQTGPGCGSKRGQRQ